MLDFVESNMLEQQDQHKFNGLWIAFMDESLVSFLVSTSPSASSHEIDSHTPNGNNKDSLALLAF